MNVHVKHDGSPEGAEPQPTVGHGSESLDRPTVDPGVLHTCSLKATFVLTCLLAVTQRSVATNQDHYRWPQCYTMVRHDRQTCAQNPLVEDLLTV